jgi:membrane protein implicated in regulation of membrane protease activity
MTIKNKTGLILTFIIFLVTLFITIRLSGHKHSLGILAIGLFFIDFFALLSGLILYWTKLLKVNMLLVFTGFIIVSFTLFILYHRTYNSYHQTRKILWGLNGEM